LALKRIPSRGDIVWAEFGAPVGSEQGGRRPALVLSDQQYHAVSARVLVCPISSVPGDWVFDVPLPAGMRIGGKVLVDQLRFVDGPERLFRFIERAPEALLDEVRARIDALLRGDRRS
jgi:mRNA interferase MazF